jgi:hypothetical protein
LPFDQAVLRCRQVQKHRKPKGHGCYVPALGALRQVLSEANFPGKLGAVNVLFFSDGRPSDHSQPRAVTPSMPGGPMAVRPTVVHMVMDYLLMSCYHTLRTLPHTFKLHCVGFGGYDMRRYDTRSDKEEFATLQAMAGAFEWAYGMGGVGFFHNSGLHLEQLKQARLPSCPPTYPTCPYLPDRTIADRTITVAITASSARFLPLCADAIYLFGFCHGDAHGHVHGRGAAAVTPGDLCRERAMAGGRVFFGAQPRA